MTELNDCLEDCIDIMKQRADYLTHRIQQKQALDAEIEHLRESMREDFFHIAVLSHLIESPPASTPEASTPEASTPEAPAPPVSAPEAPVTPAAKSEIQPEPEVKSASKRIIIPPHHPVLQLDTTGRVIQRYESTRAAERVVGIANTQISRAAKTKRPLHGFFWQFEDDKTPTNFDRPIIVETCDGNFKSRYESPFEAAKYLGVASDHIIYILRTDTHKDERARCYYWYADEYDEAHNNDE